MNGTQLSRLTPRQLELARLVHKGLGNAEIGHAMGLTHHTVNAYLHAIYDRLGIVSESGPRLKLALEVERAQ